MKVKRITEELKLLHDKSLVASVDNVSGNVAFVCKRRYAQIVINELGLNNVNTISSSTYMKATKPVAKIVSDNT